MAPGLYLPMAAMEVHGGALSRHCDRGRAPVCLGDATALRPERRLRERGGAGDSTKGPGVVGHPEATSILPLVRPAFPAHRVLPRRRRADLPS